METIPQTRSEYRCVTFQGKPKANPVPRNGTIATIHSPHQSDPQLENSSQHWCSTLTTECKLVVLKLGYGSP